MGILLIHLFIYFYLKQQLEEQAKKPPEEKLESAEPERESKHQSVAQIIYAANRVSTVYFLPELI